VSDAGGGAGVGAGAAGDDGASLEELHRQAMAIDLESTPLHKQSWLTSTVIDALLFRFARAFPDVAFLPCAFAAFELPQACKGSGERLRALALRDVLGRAVPLQADAFGPVLGVPGYERLPTHLVPPPASPLSSSFSSSSSSSSSLLLSSSSSSSFSFPQPPQPPMLRLPAQVHGAGAGPPSLAAPAALLSAAAAAAAAARARAAGAAGLAASAGPVRPSPWAALLTLERPRPPVLAASAPIAPRYASPNRPLLFFYNAGGMHWCFVRVTLGLRKRIELYEPMGRPDKGADSARAANVYRADGLSLRAVPRHLIEWLDAVCPLGTEAGWKERSLSAITQQHQLNGFDCGVACCEFTAVRGGRRTLRLLRLRKRFSPSSPYFASLPPQCSTPRRARRASRPRPSASAPRRARSQATGRCLSSSWLPACGARPGNQRTVRVWS
jgi:hypothetical protein